VSVFEECFRQKGLLRFVSVEGNSGADVQHLVDGLVDYVELSRAWYGIGTAVFPELDPRSPRWAKPSRRASAAANFP
jgi:hypothetical protein